MPFDRKVQSVVDGLDEFVWFVELAVGCQVLGSPSRLGDLSMQFAGGCDGVDEDLGGSLGPDPVDVVLWRFAAHRQCEVLREILAVFDSCVQVTFFCPEGRMGRRLTAFRNDLDQWFVDGLHAREFAAGGDLVNSSIIELVQRCAGGCFDQSLPIQFSFWRLQLVKSGLAADPLRFESQRFLDCFFIVLPPEFIRGQA